MTETRRRKRRKTDLPCKHGVWKSMQAHKHSRLGLVSLASWLIHAASC